jgi:hypothetical protein
MTYSIAKSTSARKHQGDVRTNQRNNRWFGDGLFCVGEPTN